MELTQMVGIGAGVLTAISMLPQLIKVIREKKADDISPLMLVMLICGLGLWIWYGALRADLPVLLTNIFSALVNISLLLACILCRKKTSTKQ